MSWCVMPHTEAHIDFWVNESEKKIWTHGKGQLPPNVHEIEEGAWKPYRLKTTQTTKWPFVGTVAECVIGKQTDIDHYRWYPKSFLGPYLAWQTREDTHHQFFAPDPDTKHRLQAETIALHPLLWGDQLGHKWTRRPVEILPDNFFNLHADYEPMPSQDQKVTHANCFDECKEFIYSHLRVKGKKPTVVDFSPFSSLAGNLYYEIETPNADKRTHTTTKQQPSTFHFMRSMRYAYRLPLCRLRVHTEQEALDYANIILDACLILFRSSTNPEKLPLGGWVPFVGSTKSVGAYDVYYSSNGLSKAQLKEVRSQIAIELGRTTHLDAHRWASYFDMMEIEDETLQKLCCFGNNADPERFKLFKSVDMNYGTISRSKTDWTSIGQAFLRGAYIETLIYQNNHVILFTTHAVKYNIFHEKKSHIVYATSLNPSQTMLVRSNAWRGSA